MTFAPALTWMHLLPPGASFECATAPQWFSNLVRPYSHKDGPKFKITLNENMSGWVNENLSAEGFVGINCQGLDRSGLSAAGYDYVRGFAAIPNLENARWFIPLDSPGVSSAGFNLYSPTRLSARFKRAAVQVLARTGLPLWYRDSVWLVQKQKPLLEQTIIQWVSGKEIRLALSAGAPEPARNRKASAAVMELDGNILGFAKISGSPLARRLLQSEASFLSLLATRPTVRDCVPKLLGASEVDDRFVLVQSPVTGGAAQAQITPAHRKFLTALESSTVKPATATGLVASLPSRLRVLGDAAAELEPPLHNVLASLSGCSVPSTFVHGDFAPWNIRQGKDTLCCYDWEYGRADGVPLIDETHHELQVGYLLKGWTIEQADEKLTALSLNHPRFTADHVSALQNVYMLDVLLRLAEEGYPAADPMIAWTRHLLERRVSRTPAIGVAA